MKLRNFETNIKSFTHDQISLLMALDIMDGVFEYYHTHNDLSTYYGNVMDQCMDVISYYFKENELKSILEKSPELDVLAFPNISNRSTEILVGLNAVFTVDKAAITFENVSQFWSSSDNLPKKLLLEFNINSQ